MYKTTKSIDIKALSVFLGIAILLIAAAIAGYFSGQRDLATKEKAVPTTTVITQELTPSGEVLCVWATDGVSGSLSCDWDNAIYE